MATEQRGACELMVLRLHTKRANRLFAWIGVICLFLIVPVKGIRWVNESVEISTLVGVAPSLLGPAGLLFLILSSSGRLSRLTLGQVTMLVTLIALGLEFAQLLPRPGILANVYYTFAWLDIIASLFSVSVAHYTARFITYKYGKHHVVDQ